MRCAGLGLAVDQAAEQHVVLHRRGGVVALRVVELDVVAIFLRQGLGKAAPRRQQLGLQLGIDQAQAVPRLDIREGDGDQPLLVGRRGFLQAAALHARQQLLHQRQIVGGDEAELLEEGMARRQVREQFDHGLGDLFAHRDERRLQALGLDHLGQHLVVAQGREIEHRAARRAEQQVLRHRHVAVVFGGIELLDQVREVGLLQPAMNGDARLQEAFGDRRLVIRIDPPAQAELIDIVLQLHRRAAAR